MLYEVSEYLNRILVPQLLSFGVSASSVDDLCRVIETQMISLIFHWNDLKFRKAVLLTALEEGLFYEPKGKVDIRCFVVATVRNSPFESLQSHRYTEYGLSKSLTDDQIKMVTSSAIEYFSQVSFDVLSHGLQKETPTQDLYGDLAKQCPVAWNTLVHLGSSYSKRIFFTPLEVSSPFILSGVQTDIEAQADDFEAVLDGYSMDIDPILSQQLGYIANVKGFFALDCFKMLSRNIQKLLYVMEYLLTRGCPFVTSNFYIENGYAEKRSVILRAASCKTGIADYKQHLLNTKGLGPKHSSALKITRSSIE